MNDAITDSIRQRIAKDPTFRARVIDDPTLLGRANVRVLEDTDELLHLVVPTEPVVFDDNATHRDAADVVIARAQRDPDFRAQLFADPRRTLETELGVDLPPDLRVVAIQDNEHVVHVVVPPFQAAGPIKKAPTASSSSSASWGGDVTTDDSPCTVEGNSFCTATRGCKSLGGGGPCGGPKPEPSPTPTPEPTPKEPTKIG